MDNAHPAMVLALASIAPPPTVGQRRYLPPETLNQDDWYVFDSETHELAYVLGSKYQKPTVKEGQQVMRGMTVQRLCIHLWKAVQK
jgi:hypothetical protein